MTTLCGCTRPTRAGYIICDTCRADLERHLAEMAWLDEQLDISLIRAKGVDYRAGNEPRSSESPLPWNDRASRARHELKNELVGWVRILRSSGDEWPTDTLAAIAAWLLSRLDTIAKHDAAWNIREGIEHASNRAKTVIDSNPPRRFVGPCEGRIQDDGDEIIETECPGEIFLTEGTNNAECDKCHRTYDSVEAIRAQERRLENSGIMLTASQIAKTAHRGLAQPQEKVLRQIDAWRRRGRLASKGTHRCSDDGDFCSLITDKETRQPRCLLVEKPVYAYSDAKAMLVEAYGDAS